MAYAVLCGYAAVSMWFSSHKAADDIGGGVPQESGGRSQESGVGSLFSRDRQGAPEPAPKLLHRLLWIALPAFASVVLLATTNHVSTDVTPMPFLWVVPLSLYLVTFIIAFDHPRWYWPVGVSIFTLLAVYVLGMAFSAGLHPLEVKKYGLPGKVFQQTAKAFHRTEEKPRSQMMNRPAPIELRSVSRRTPPCVLSRCSVSACSAMENWCAFAHRSAI